MIHNKGRLHLLTLVAMLCVTLASCQSTPPSMPSTPVSPTPRPESWYFYPQLGSPPYPPSLEGVEVDRTAKPPRVRLPVGTLVALRAKFFDSSCGATPSTFIVNRWVASEPSVIKIEPTSTESANVTALAPGISRVTAERTLQDGSSLSVVGLGDPGSSETACAPQSEYVFEVRP